MHSDVCHLFLTWLRIHPCCVAAQAMLEKAVSERSYVESHGKPVPGFSFMSASEADTKIADRRKQVHGRWLKLWAKRILATPEQALVPLKERDALLASRHEVRGGAAGFGVKPGNYRVYQAL
jgi:hypothetical protein